MKPSIGITEKNLSKSTTILSQLLADEMLLYVKTRKFHWNVSGNSFMELHKLFQEQFIQIEETADLIAERITKLGGKAIGTLKEFSSLSSLKESANEYPAQQDMLKELMTDHEKLSVHYRHQIDKLSKDQKDAGTVDFLTGILENHESNAWIFRRYLAPAVQ